MSIVLAVDNVRKSFGIKPLLTGVTFSLYEGQKMGVIGANGSGKTTLLRILAGEETADSGEVVVPGGRRVAYLPQNPTFTDGLSVLDALFDGAPAELRLLHDYEEVVHALEAAHSGTGDDAPDTDRLLARLSTLSAQMDATGGWDREAEARALLSRSGLDDVSQAVETLSGGQRKRVALARALLLRPDLLILDEPTNHLDADTIAWLEATPRGLHRRRASRHARPLLPRPRHRRHAGARPRAGAALRGQLHALPRTQGRAGGAPDAPRSSGGRTSRGANSSGCGAAPRRARPSRRPASTAPRPSSSRPTAPARPSRRSRSRRRGLASRHARRRPRERDEGLRRAPTFVQDLTLSLTRGTRLGIVGAQRDGQDDAPRPRRRALRARRGTVETGPTVVVGYYDQESRALVDDIRLIDYIKEVAENVRTADGSLITASQMLERFLFPPAQQYTPVGLLSGGERRRLYLLRILMQAPNVLLLDEPTNDLDLSTLVALEDYLDTFGGAVVVVSHDRYFLDRTAEHVAAPGAGDAAAHLPRRLHGDDGDPRPRGVDGDEARRARNPPPRLRRSPLPLLRRPSPRSSPPTSADDGHARSADRNR